MIDLHIHTIYSDGYFDCNDIIKRQKNCDLISVTDHNSICMYLKLLESDAGEYWTDKTVVGTEITANGYPDILIYYPEIDVTDTDKLQCIEALLKEIRLEEENHIKSAFEYLKQNDSVKYSDWNNDFVLYSPDGKTFLEARTRDLAVTRHKLKTNSVDKTFDKDDLREARIARSTVDKSANSKGNPFKIADITNGKVALAHPIRSAYILLGRQIESYEKIQSTLDKLLDYFINNGGKIVEWEYLESDISRYKPLAQYEQQLRNVLAKRIETDGLKCIWGTDSHKQFPYDSREWSDKCYEMFRDKIPEWLRRKLNE